MIGIVMDVSRDEFYRAIDEVKAGIQGVHDRLDALNGRTRGCETQIAVLQDRSARDPAARWGAAGAFLAALAAGLANFFRS